MDMYENTKHEVLAVQIGHISEGMTRIEKALYDMKRDVHREMDELKVEIHKQINELKQEIRDVDNKHTIDAEKRDKRLKDIDEKHIREIEKIKAQHIIGDKEALVVKMKQGFIVAGLVSAMGIATQIIYIFLKKGV